MPSGLSEFAEVAIPVAVYGTFTYAIPPELLDGLRRRPLPFAAALEASWRASIARLRDAGMITVGDRVQDAKGVRYDRFVVLETPPGGLTAKQQQAVEILSSRGGEMSVRAM